MSDHHRRVIRYSVDHMAFLEGQIEQLDQDIAARIREAGLEPQWQLLQSVPGVQETSAGRNSSGDRNGHDAVSLGEAHQFMGGNLSGQQSECGQE